MKKNIMYILGNDSYAQESEKNHLIKLFSEKYWPDSVEICPLWDEKNFLEYYQKIVSVGLFHNARMFVFYGGKEKKWRQKKEDFGFEKFLEDAKNLLSDTDFLLFHSLSSGEEKLKKWLENNASPREKNIPWNTEFWEKKYNISRENAKKILTRYQNAENLREKNEENPFLGHAITLSMKQISILEKTETITENILDQFCHEYQWAKIFDFIDAIMVKNREKSLYILRQFSLKIQSQDEMIIFLAQLLGILKKNLYIIFLRENGYKKPEILKILTGINAFVLDKALKSSLSLGELQKIFQKIEMMIIAYRSGKWMKETILWQFLEIDTVLFDLKK